MNKWTQIQTKKNIQTDGQTVIQINRQRDRETDRQKNRNKGIKTDR